MVKVSMPRRPGGATATTTKEDCMCKRFLWVGFLVLFLWGCESNSITSPVDPGTESLATSSAVVSSASGGYHFLIPADFNGGIFGGEVDNVFAFTAKLHADGSVSGHYTYKQYDGSLDKTYRIGGRVTCLQIYDTPVLVRTPEIPGMTANRAKWGGSIDRSNDPDFPVGMFVWAQSIDNGEGANDHPDVSTLVGLGDEAENEAFCASSNVPNPDFGPHRIDGGNIQVRP
jgi:hypothetical protein